MTNRYARLAAAVCCLPLVVVTAQAASGPGAPGERGGKHAGCVRSQGGPAEKPSIEQAVNSLFAVQDYAGTAISPDGRHVAWIDVLKRNGVETGGTAIYVRAIDAAQTAPRRITAGAAATSHTETDIAWSPDGSHIAFFSDATTPGQAELYVVPATGGPARRLTNVKGFLSDPEWSPDGKTIAILFTENAPRAAGPLEPMTPQTGVIEEHYYEQRLTVIDVAT
ncbi:MAG TPA: hypothetical protein VI756_29820, partial [Blastocatellia bacterium]